MASGLQTKVFRLMPSGSLENETTGNFQPFSMNDTYYNTSSAECVAEWPNSFGSPYLPDYGTVLFTNCNVVTTTSGGAYDPISSFNYDEDIDVNSLTGDVVQEPQGGFIQPGIFQVVWKAHT